MKKANISPCRKQFYRTVSLLLTLFLLLGSLPFAVSAENTVYTITELNGKYKTQGRTAVVDGALRLDWSASGMIFTADCKGDVKITVEPTRINTSSEYGDYFTVYVDGVMQYEDLRIPENNSTVDWTSNSTNYPFHITKTGETEYTIASNLPSGEHTFEIYHQNEAANARFGIKSVSLNGSFLPPPENNDLYIEIIGDSISASFGNISKDDNRAPLYQDSTRGWPFLTARALNADWSLIARTGITATAGIGFSGAESIAMPDIYPYLRYYSDTETKYNFARQPDVIVVCLGTNDMSTYGNIEGNTIDVVKKGFANLLTMLRNYNPDSKIVWIYGMMTSAANTHIKEALANAGGVEKGYYGFELPAEPTNAHPKLNTQYQYTALLSDYIENVVLDPEYKESYATEKTDVTIYRATNAADNINEAYYSDKNSVWKFGVSGLGDTFKTSSADFSAPKAEITEENYLKLSWNKPQTATGKTVLKVIGESYNKELYIGGNSVILKDAPLNEKLQIQVTVGDVSSEILTYYKDPILTDLKITDANKNATTKIDPNSYLFADLTDIASKIDDNTGILIKLESVITDETIMVTHYSDLKDYDGAFIERNADSPVANFQYPISLNDLGMTFNWRMTPTTVNSDGTLKASTTAYTNNTTDRTRNFYAYDHALDDKPAAIKSTEQNSFHLTSKPQSLYTQFYKSGYILVPFESFTDSDLEQIKKTGVISLKADTFFYRGRVRRNKNGNQDVNYVQYGCTSLDPAHTNEANLGGLIDREMHYSQVSFVNDFDTFVNGFVNDATTTIATPETSVNSPVQGTVYMNSTANGSDYNLTSDKMKSSYFVDDTDNYANKIIFTTTAGEKMKLGFTAPKKGIYEISAPITADIAKGIHYRVIKETANGVVSILQDEKTYQGEKYFTLMTSTLSKSDTVYLEAWSDNAGATINIGIPQFIHLNNGSDENSIIFKANDHLAITDMNDFGSESVWKFGTFVNPFIADGTEYQYLNSTDFANATAFDYDVLGITELSATDKPNTTLDETDGSKLFDALSPYEGIATYSDANNDIFYQSELNGLGYKNSAYNTQKPYRYAWSGQLTTDKRKYNNNVSIRYGLALAAGGGQKNVYINFGHYQQFTAPTDGNITLNLGSINNPGKIIVMHNKKVVATYLGDTITDSNNTVTVNTKMGDTLTIAHGTVSDNQNNLSITDTGNVAINPVVYFIPSATSTSTVKFDSEIPVMMNEKICNGEIIELPATSKAGAQFLGWKINNTIYNSGDEFTVTENAAFKAHFVYFGDLDSSGAVINGTDITVMRKILLGKTDINNIENGKLAADIDANDEINLIDLIRMKKIAADINVSVGIQ